MAKNSYFWDEINKKLYINLKNGDIMMRCRRFGPDGPYKNKLAYDVMVSGIGGLMAITGTEDGTPVKVRYLNKISSYAHVYICIVISRFFQDIIWRFENLIGEKAW